MAGTREASKVRLQRIKEAAVKGPAHKTGPFANATSKTTGLTPARVESRVNQEKELGMRRGRKAAYSGD